MTLSLDQTARILKISSATVKNWLKSGVLKSTNAVHVKETKEKIRTGGLNKLQRGANKHQSRKVHTHTELLSRKENAAALKPLIEKYRRQKKQLLLAVYLRQLADAKIALKQNLKNELAEWKVSTASFEFSAILKEVMALQADFSDNILGYLHQSLNETSAKQDLGAYYTPSSVIHKALQNIEGPGRICDPCCGSGNFLVEAYLHIKEKGWSSPETFIYGYDCDPLAVLIARANLTLASRNSIDVLRAISHRDFLMSQPMEEFRYILTNPPWGAIPAKSQTKKLQKKFGLKKTKDSFSYFLISSLQNTQHNGFGQFILPVSFMNVAAHTEIRKYLFTNSTVQMIELLEEKFSGVMTKAILISFQNSRPAGSHKVMIKSGQSCRVSNSEILESENCILPLDNDEHSLKVIREIEGVSCGDLRGKSTWGLGLVTGNNDKFLFETPGRNRAPIVTGSQIFRFRQPEANLFCLADTAAFQQAAPLAVYRADRKLVYRFIAKELVFAIDTEGLFTLNSANVLIPSGGPYSCELLCGLFNSRLGQYYFAKKFSSIKVLRSHLEKFPLPRVNEKIFSQITNCVSKLQKGYARSIADDLDRLVIKAYGLSKKSETAVLNHAISGAFYL